jgi:hypothetical protein
MLETPMYLTLLMRNYFKKRHAELVSASPENEILKQVQDDQGKEINKTFCQ